MDSRCQRIIPAWKKAITFITILLLSNVASAQVIYWTEPATVKIRRSDQAGINKSVTLKAARNEYESFQVAVRGANPITITDVSVTDLTNSLGIISNNNIRIFREAYIKITTPSNLEGQPGFWPVALIPEKDVYFNESRNALPVSVPGDQNQAVWIDVFVPQSASPGVYTGNLTITISGHPQINVPVSLAVWDFYIPSTSSLVSAFGFDGWDFQLGHFGGLDHHNQIVPLSRLYAKAALGI